MTYQIALGLGVLIALSQIGVEVGPVLAGLGVAGVVIGFALQNTLSNFASGMLILAYRPFDVGHVISAGGVTGKVERMTLVTTTILTFDNQQLIVPNNKIWGDVITNITVERVRRVDLTFGIGYSDDVDHAERVLREIVDNHEKVLAEPEPTIKLHELGDSSVNFIVRPWALTVDYWDVYWGITREVKRRFDAEGISIPFPQRDVHLIPSRREDEGEPEPAT
jgi:small conductance mechanosensitive channel